MGLSSICKVLLLLSAILARFYTNFTILYFRFISLWNILYSSSSYCFYFTSCITRLILFLIITSNYFCDLFISAILYLSASLSMLFSRLFRWFVFSSFWLKALIYRYSSEISLNLFTNYSLIEPSCLNFFLSPMLEALWAFGTMFWLEAILRQPFSISATIYYYKV